MSEFVAGMLVGSIIGGTTGILVTVVYAQARAKEMVNQIQDALIAFLKDQLDDLKDQLDDVDFQKGITRGYYR